MGLTVGLTSGLWANKNPLRKEVFFWPTRNRNHFIPALLTSFSPLFSHTYMHTHIICSLILFFSLLMGKLYEDKDCCLFTVMVILLFPGTTIVPGTEYVLNKYCWMNEVARKRLSEKETFKLRPEDGSRHVRRGWEEETLPSGGNSRCKVPEAEKELT